MPRSGGPKRLKSSRPRWRTSMLFPPKGDRRVRATSPPFATNSAGRSTTKRSSCTPRTTAISRRAPRAWTKPPRPPAGRRRIPNSTGRPKSCASTAMTSRPASPTSPTLPKSASRSSMPGGKKRALRWISPAPWPNAAAPCATMSGRISRERSRMRRPPIPPTVTPTSATAPPSATSASACASRISPPNA